MEAVGQLSRGIAHDFNNLLAVHHGSLEVLQRRLARGDVEVGRFIDGALSGADRAAKLTHRLLAFARKAAAESGARPIPTTSSAAWSNSCAAPSARPSRWRRG